jgi:hypothetical protein
MENGTAIVDPERDFRLPPALHQRFDLVFVVEKELGAIKQWPLVLDEALRAVRPGGIVVLRLIESGLLSIFQLANAIEKWTGGQHVLIDQISDDGRFLLAVQLTHEQPRAASTTDFTFALITDGRKPGAVARFVDSVLALPSGPGSSEIIICGPASITVDLGERASCVRLIPQPEEFSELGWITRKKNLLIDAATRENVIVAHDRYLIPADFIARMKDFGGDFDVIAPRQTSTDGRPLPDLVTISDHLNWSTPGWLEFGDYHPFGYVNGGVIVAKTERLRRTRWSELLFWGQAEDVDLSRRLQDVGVTPRPAREIRLVSEPPRAGFVEGFERLPWIDGFYPRSPRPDRAHVSTTGPMALALQSTAFVRMGEVLAFEGSDGILDAAKGGFIFGKGWAAVPDAVIWKAAGSPGISLRFQGAHTDIALMLQFSDAETAARLLSVGVNGIREAVLERDAAVVRVLIPQDVVTDSKILHIWMTIDGGPLSLGAMQLTGVAVPPSRSARRPL